jgi:OOP family OmpA-OmpF porin
MRSLAWLVGIALFALLAWFCISRGAPRIEADLTTRARAALDAAGIDPELVRIDGRDACLRIASADAGPATQILEDVRGIRVVEADCDVTAATAQPAASTRTPYFKAERETDRIVVSGALPADVADAMAGVAAAMAPGVPIDGQIERQGVATAPWTAQLPQAVRLIAARVLDPALVIEDGRLTVSGRVPSAAVRDGVIAALTEQFPALTVTDRLEVRPPQDAEELQRGLDQFVASRVVEFDFGSAQLTPQGRGMVEEVAALLASQPSLGVSIEGHTDEVGDPESNQALSERRAESVRDYLVELGLSPDRFSTRGFGETRPVADNTTEEGRQRNRRTEFHVQGEN